VAIGGIILPLIGGYSAALAFGFEQSYALFFGVLFCATSVSISVQVLKEMDQLNTREGTTILGAAVVDDVLVVILLAFIMSILGQGSDVSLGLLIGKKILFFVVIIAACLWLVPLVMKWFARLKVTEPVISAGLILCFAFAYFAEWMQMAGIIGAFAAGIAVSQTPFKHQVEKKIEPIAYSIFVPVFFVSIGLNVTFDGIGSQVWLLVVITIMAIITKLLGGWLGARLTGFNNRSSLAIGSGMISRGEVALIIAATGLQAGLLQQEYFTSVVIMVIITTLVTPPMLKIFFSSPSSAQDSKTENVVDM
jgi:Kef-type K+ transport system membrane component KefB